MIKGCEATCSIRESWVSLQSVKTCSDIVSHIQWRKVSVGSLSHVRVVSKPLFSFPTLHTPDSSPLLASQVGGEADLTRSDILALEQSFIKMQHDVRRSFQILGLMFPLWVQSRRLRNLFTCLLHPQTGAVSLQEVHTDQHQH